VLLAPAACVTVVLLTVLITQTHSTVTPEQFGGLDYDLMQAKCPSRSESVSAGYSQGPLWPRSAIDKVYHSER